MPEGKTVALTEDTGWQRGDEAGAIGPRVEYTQSGDLVALLSRLDVSLMVSSYQSGDLLPRA